MKQQKKKRIVAYIVLFALVIIALWLSYIKFFSEENTYIEEVPVNESSSKAIHETLENITNKFNQNTEVSDYEVKNNVNLSATVNNYSIFISYITDTTVTYEFAYDDLCLNIIVNDDIAKREEFKVIYGFLIRAVQERINNIDDTDNLNKIIDEFLNNDTSFNGLSKEIIDGGIKYQMNITKKIKYNQAETEE